MRLWSDSFSDGERIPVRHALGKPGDGTPVTFAANENPHLAWADLPTETRSLVVLCRDVDVPTKPDDVNKEGRTVPGGLARGEFFHWVLVDVDPTAFIEAGAFSRGVIPKGKPGPEGPQRTRQGLNDYTGWFDGDPEMEGRYFGYDGPCPPWNDERVHHYHFEVHALDIERCPVEGVFTGPDVRKAMEGHILGKASIVGSYAIYTQARVWK